MKITEKIIVFLILYFNFFPFFSRVDFIWNHSIFAEIAVKESRHEPFNQLSIADIIFQP